MARDKAPGPPGETTRCPPKGPCRCHKNRNAKRTEATPQGQGDNGPQTLRHVKGLGGDHPTVRRTVNAPGPDNFDGRRRDRRTRMLNKQNLVWAANRLHHLVCAPKKISTEIFHARNSRVENFHFREFPRGNSTTRDFPRKISISSASIRAERRPPQGSSPLRIGCSPVTFP
jgi:hypothetical protein